MIKRIILITLISVLLIANLGMAYVIYCIKSAPEIDTSNIYSLLEQRTIIYDDNGKSIDSISFYDGNRTIVSYEDMPEVLINAMVSIEDKTFWEHHGFNFVRILGAIKERVFSGGAISGTSTITQQLARNIYLADKKSERSMKRKITEAYYTVLIERNLTKKQIIEAYLNTVYFGFGCYGVETASANYFGKDVADLTLLESAALASIPQMPDSYALVYPDYDGTSELPKLKVVDGVQYVYNGDASKDRRELVLNNMVEFGYITPKRAENAKSKHLEKRIKLKGSKITDSHSMYFIDYAIGCVKTDLMKELDLSEEDATNMLYAGGLKIYTTLDMKRQKIMAEEFKDDSNYTSISYLPKDAEGNILSKRGIILLYNKDSYFEEHDDFVLSSEECKVKDGSLIIQKNKRLNIAEDGTLKLKPLYAYDGNILYVMQDGKLDIPQDYISVQNGNCVIDKAILDDHPEIMFKKDGKYRISEDYIEFGTKSKQPQAAAVLIENKTGQVKAMMGGRNTSTGRNLYNRAVTPHQPGSSIKPIGVYGPALQKSVEFVEDGKGMDLDFSRGDRWGSYLTAGSQINDAPTYYNGKLWPQNAYRGYRGRMSLRKAVQQSVNVCAVKVFAEVGVDYSASMLKKNGITSVVESGNANDMNPAALALGGMTNGISPLELAAAYETFPNGGKYKEPIFYTKITDRNNNVVLENKQQQKRVYDEGVAWIMTDILRTVVTQGIAGNAAIYSQPVGGKTGTTSDQYDIWFSGFSPQYTMALWEGNDVHIQLSSMSEAAASFWGHIMRRMCEGYDYTNFKEQPDNIIYSGGEYYVRGTR